MIDFIEIHAVQLADGIWHFALLIKQSIAARYRHQRTGGIPQGQFKHLRIFNRCGQGLPCRSRDGRFGPAERRCIAQFLPVQLIARCIRDAQAAAGGNAGVHPDFYRVLLRGKVDGCRAVRSIHRVLRCFHAAKVGKAHHSNDQRQRCQGFLLFSRPGRLRINAQGAQFQLFLHCFCFIFFDGFHFCQWRNRSMAADGPRGESQQHKGCRFGKADCHGKLAAGIAAEPLVIAAYQGIHSFQVQEARYRQTKPGAIQTDVIPARRSKQYQQHAQHQVTLVHAMGKGKNPHRVKRCQQQRGKPPRPPADDRQHHKQHRDNSDVENAQHFPAQVKHRASIQRLPVAAQRCKPVKRIDGGILVARRRGDVLIDQGRHQIFCPVKRQACQQRRQQSQRSTAKNLADRFQRAFAIPHGIRNSHQKADGQHRPSQQCLRLDGQRHAVQHRSEQVAALFQQPEAEQQRQRKSPIDLLPDAGIKQGQRAERRKQHQAALCPALPHIPAADMVQQHHSGTITDCGDQCQQKIGPAGFIAQLERLAHQADQPQHKDVAGRVVRKIIGTVKGRGTFAGQLIPPGHKAAHIIGVAFSNKGQQQTRGKRCGQYNIQRSLFLFGSGICHSELSR